MTPESWEFAKQETKLHEIVSNHQNVVKLFDQVETPKDFQMYMEYCDKGAYLPDKILEVSHVSHLRPFLKFASVNFLTLSCA